MNPNALRKVTGLRAVTLAEEFRDVDNPDQ
jgi:hypothetical protein